MTAEEVADIMWQLLQALQYLHGVDVWHRDLKSSNLLLSRAGARRIVKARFAALYQRVICTDSVCHWAGWLDLQAGSAFDCAAAAGKS